MSPPLTMSFILSLPAFSSLSAQNFTVSLILAESDCGPLRRGFDVVIWQRHVVLIVHYNHHRNTLRSPDLWSNWPTCSFSSFFFAIVFGPNNWPSHFWGKNIKTDAELIFLFKLTKYKLRECDHSETYRKSIHDALSIAYGSYTVNVQISRQSPYMEMCACEVWWFVGGHSTLTCCISQPYPIHGASKNHCFLVRRLRLLIESP